MSELTQATEQLMPHILVVDDDPVIRQVIPLRLQKNNLKVTCAENVAEASKLLALEQFDAIVSDVMMPGEDGISFLARVHEFWPEIPVILMTGNAQLQMAINAIKHGAFDFVCKPLDFDHLAKLVHRAVNYRNLQRIEKNYRAELEATVARITAELKLSMAELDSARVALQQAATDKSNFMSTISHEMRTPMNGVIGSLDLLQGEGLSGAAAEFLAMARQSADSMVALIDQLLSFNSLTVQTAGALHNEFFDLKSLLQSIIAGQQPLFTRKAVTLSLQMADNLPRQIWNDREKICRLLEILLGNALKFTVHGAVTLAASLICTDGDGDLLNFTVTDSGIGIPEGMLERIFEPFVQGDGSLTRRYEGAGLGLAIARQNALLLNGHLWAEHVPDGGSRFSVTLSLLTP